MSRTLTALIPFKIGCSFYQCTKKFFTKAVHRRHSEFDINPLFRAFSKYHPQKLIYVYKALEGNIQKFVQSNSDWIKTQKVDFINMEELS